MNGWLFPYFARGARCALRLHLVGIVISGCKDDDGDSGRTDPTPTIEGVDLVITDDHNYGFEGELTIGAVEVAPGTDLAVDWCSLTEDLRGRPVEPTTVDQLLLVEFQLTQEEVVADVEANTLLQADAVTQWLLLNPQDCRVQTTEFDILANAFDPALFDPASGTTWLLSLTDRNDAAFEILTSKFVVPTDGENRVEVQLTDGCSSLAVEVDLRSGRRLHARAGDRGVADWSLVTTDVHGNPYDEEKGTRLLIGKIAVDTLEEVEALFLRLDDEAEAIYYLDVYGTTRADLAEAMDEGGTPFPGFTTDGIWLVGVECIGPIECLNPAPLILAVVEVEP